MAETALERAERQYQQAKARLSAAKAREASAERKRDTRRKVILGGALIDLAARDDRALALLNRLIDNLTRDQDRASFDDWERPRAEQPRGDVGQSENRIAPDAPQGVSQRGNGLGTGTPTPMPSNGSTGVYGGAPAMQGHGLQGGDRT